jgi:AAHS family 4-hydroxybenzoate transporter-like MFS transporter
MTLDINEIVDGQKMGPALLTLYAVALLTLLSDGFDLAAMGYLAPELVKEWGLSPAGMVPAFSAGIIGMMIGGPVLGILGDKHGRKRVIIGGLIGIGVTTLATMAARSVADLVVLRFLTGIMLGGVLPNTIALVAEVTPRFRRGKVLIAIGLGIVIGIALPGLVSAWLIPLFGWRALLLVGGLLPIIVAIAAMVLVPESMKYLLVHGDRDDEVRAIARRFRPDLPIDETTRITLPPEVPTSTASSLKLLFAGGLALVTPLLWFCQAAAQMANFFSLTWLPTLLQSAGASTADASLGASLFAIGGLLGGLALMFVIDRCGVVPLVVLFVLGTPLVAMLTNPGVSPPWQAAIIAGAGLCVTGLNIVLVAVLGIIYPTAIRSMGTGFTQAAGRVGALAAPIVGGLLIDLKVPLEQLTLAPAGLLALGAVASSVLTWRCYRAFGGIHLTEFPLPATAI